MKNNINAEKEKKFEYQRIIHLLSDEFAKTAIERDKRGGTAEAECLQLKNSGILSLIIPQSFGGKGENWRTVLDFTRELAKVDASIAHIFGYHFLCLTSVYLYGSEQQTEKFYTETAENNFFWGNAYNPRDNNLVIERYGTKWRLNGKKSFCSGSRNSDKLLISAKKQDNNELLIAVLPTKRQGILIQDDWDGFGQRQTDSGTVIFNEVLLNDDEVLNYDERDPKNVFPTIRTHIAQTILLHVLLGVAEGALAEAKKYTTNTARPWLTSPAEQAAADPYVIRQYGELYVQIKASAALAQEAAIVLQNLWDKDNSLTLEERGECGIKIATAKVSVIRTALEVTNKMFELMGARSASSKYQFDRFWRNVRTLSLHDPIEYRIRDIGNWALNDQLPDITPYS